MELFFKDLKEKTPKEIFVKYLLSSEVWYFKHYMEDTNYHQTYDKFKHYINQKLGIHINDIAIVGSAKVGFSLSPDKNFRTFNEESDIDLVLVSRIRFTSFWDAYLEMYSNSRFINNYESVTRGLFKQFIELDGFDNKNKTFIEWSKLVNGFYTDLQIDFEIPNKVNYLIFESWDAVTRYYTRNIDSLKKIHGGQDAI